MRERIINKQFISRVMIKALIIYEISYNIDEKLIELIKELQFKNEFM